MIAAAAGLLVVAGSLSTLVEAASLAFLFTFATVNLLAFMESIEFRWIGLAGCVGATTAGLVLIYRLTSQAPVTLAALVGLVVFAAVGRPLILRWTVPTDQT